MMALRSTILFACLLVGTRAEQNCYFPNGTIDNFYVPCDKHARHTSCCAPTDECLTNGLCRPSDASGQRNDFWRDLCTDKTWKSDACPKYCYNSTTNSDVANTCAFVTSCSWDTYCCADPSVWASGDPYACCSNVLDVFNAGPAKWLAGPKVATAQFPRPTSTSITSSTTTSSSTSPTSTTQDSSSSSGLSTGGKAGIGVAVAVAVIAIIVAVVACVLLRRSRRRRNEAQAEVNTAWTARHNSEGYLTGSGGSGAEKPVYAHYASAPQGPESVGAGGYHDTLPSVEMSSATVGGGQGLPPGQPHMRPVPELASDGVHEMGTLREAKGYVRHGTAEME